MISSLVRTVAQQGLCYTVLPNVTVGLFFTFLSLIILFTAKIVSVFSFPVCLFLHVQSSQISMFNRFTVNAFHT